MKTETIIKSTAIRHYRFEMTEFANVPVIAQGFQHRYAFLQAPRTVEEFDLSTGIAFHRGIFNRHLYIEKCTIFADGVIVESNRSTDELDAFIDDGIEWFRSVATAKPLQYSEVGRGYVSQLEVAINASIADTVDRFNELGRRITEMVMSYGPTSNPKFEFAGFRLDTDSVEKRNRALGPFVFERRAERPNADNVYYSSATLRTKDHEDILERLEAVLR